jgi:hypothetical protein
LNYNLNGVSNDIVSYSFRSVVPLASEGHVSPRSRYWSLGDEAVSVNGLEQHDNSARQQILMTACQSKVIVPADAKTPTIA